MATDLLYLRDALLRAFDATVVEAGDDGVALDPTALYDGRWPAARHRHHALGRR